MDSLLFHDGRLGFVPDLPVVVLCAAAITWWRNPLSSPRGLKSSALEATWIVFSTALVAAFVAGAIGGFLAEGPTRHVGAAIYIGIATRIWFVNLLSVPIAFLELLALLLVLPRFPKSSELPGIPS